MKAGKLDRRITILKRTATQHPVSGVDVVTWAPLATVWAEVQDVLPSRAEKVAEGVTIARRPARIRIRYRTDIDLTMRVRIGDRELRIVAGPAELGRREQLELIAEELSTEGQD